MVEVTVFPARCIGCIHIRPRWTDDVKYMDHCFVYDCLINDEMLAQPCKFYCRSLEEDNEYIKHDIEQIQKVRE